MSYTIHIDGTLYKTLPTREDCIWHLGAKYGGSEYNKLYRAGRIQWSETTCCIYMELEPPSQEWVFNFVPTGWNSVWAVTREQAIESAGIEYGKWEIDEKSFRLTTPREKRQLLADFY